LRLMGFRGTFSVLWLAARVYKDATDTWFSHPARSRSAWRKRNPQHPPRRPSTLRPPKEKPKPPQSRKGNDHAHQSKCCRPATAFYASPQPGAAFLSDAGATAQIAFGLTCTPWGRNGRHRTNAGFASTTAAANEGGRGMRALATVVADGKKAFHLAGSHRPGGGDLIGRRFGSAISAGRFIASSCDNLGPIDTTCTRAMREACTGWTTG